MWCWSQNSLYSNKLVHSKQSNQETVWRHFPQHRFGSRDTGWTLPVLKLFPFSRDTNETRKEALKILFPVWVRIYFKILKSEADSDSVLF